MIVLWWRGQHGDNMKETKMVRNRRPASATICGIGAVTGYGWGRKYLWEGVSSAEPAARLVPGFGEALEHDEAWLALVPPGGDQIDGRGRFGRAVHAAVREAVDDATDRGWRRGEVVGVVHAIVLGEVELWRDFYLLHGMRHTRKQFIELMPSTPLTTMMREHDFHGPCMGVTAMCASGNAGLLTAKMWIDAGIVSDVVVVATDISVTPENLKPFVDLGVCVVDRPSLDGCRPFQEGSGGFIVGEASVAMVVSSSPHGGYASMLGGAMTQDAHHVISIEPSHAELRNCWSRALANAGVDGRHVAYLNAHGPGTRQCDTAEAALFEEFLPEAEGLFSVKPLTGHCQGAAAAVEVAVSCMAIDTGWIPAPPQVAPGHPRLLSGLVRRRPGPELKSSVGMGGNNSAIVLREAIGA
jgi:3-oxoacyl-[acyl-carrier-protein] synthase II